MRKTVLIVVAWVLGAVTIYGAAQQILRQNANDPQIQIAEDAAARLSKGASAAAVLNQNSEINVAESLAPFMVVYNSDGKILSSSGNLNSKQLYLPDGVAQYVDSHGEDRFTWQPEAGTRLAAVVTKFDTGSGHGYVVAARSLREVERRENNIGYEIFAGAVFSILVLLLADFLLSKYEKAGR